MRQITKNTDTVLVSRACPPSAPLDNPDSHGQRSTDASSGQADIPIAEDGFLIAHMAQGPSASAINFNQGLDAQDIAWLENIPFDPNIDIDSSVAEWLDDFALYQHDHAAR